MLTPRRSILPRLLRTTGLGAWVLLASACATSADHPSAPPSSADSPPTSGSADALARVKSAIGDANCASDAQCHSVAIGHKGCGGPEAYLAWSSAVSDPARLQAAVAAQVAARRREVEAAGLISNCMWLADPGAVCRSGHCQLGDGARPAAPPAVR